MRDDNNAPKKKSGKLPYLWSLRPYPAVVQYLRYMEEKGLNPRNMKRLKSAK